MATERQKGNISYLFSLGNVKPNSFYIAVAFSIAGIVLEAFPYMSIYFIIRQVLQAAQTSVSLNEPEIYLWGILTFISLLLSVMCTMVGGYKAHRSAFSLIYGLRRKILSHMGSLPMGFFSGISTGEVQKQMESSMGKIELLLAHNIPNLIGAGPLVVALLISMFILNGWLALAVLLPILAAFLIQSIVFSSKRSRQTAVEGSHKMGEMNRWFNDYLRGISVVKIFGRHEQGFEKLDTSITEYRNHLLDFTKRSSTPFSLFKVLMLSILTFVLPVASLLISLHGGELNLVLTILMFLIITPCLYSPILELMRFGAEAQQANVAIDQIENLFKTVPLPDAVHPQIPTAYDVVFDHVSFSYQDASDTMRRWAVKDLSFCAKMGAVTALVGPSGGGKSTVGQLICRFWDVSAGAIKIGNVDVRDMALETLMDVISFVFQDTFLFSSSVFDNIAMNRPVSQEQVESAAKASMCHDFIMSLPNGYDTKLGDGGSHLSGGEAQRIAIARAILKDSPIIVLDEATAFTDADNETLIQQALGKLLRGKTVIMIAHRLATVQNAQQILVLKDGGLQQHGTHKELLKTDGIFKKLWSTQNEVENWILTTQENAEGGTAHAKTF